MEHVHDLAASISWGIKEQPVAVIIALAFVVVTAVYMMLSQKSAPGPSVLLGQTLPLLGDTLAVKEDPCAYFLQGYLRYGGVYKTSMLGMPIYVVLEPSAVREMLRGEGCTFSVPFKSFNKLLDDWDHMVDSKQHDFWRKAIATAMSHATIESYIPALAGIIQKSVQKWASRGSMNLMDEVGDMALDFAIEVLVGVPLVHTDRNWFKAKMLQYFKGLYVLALPLPGTTFSKAQAAKAELRAALVRELDSAVSKVLQDDPTAAENMSHSAKLVRLDGAGKYALLQSDPSLQLDPKHLAAAMARLKEREGAAGTATDSSKPTVHVSSHAEPAAAEEYSSSNADGDAGLLTMADAQLEVLRAQRRLSVETAAVRVMGTLIAAVDTTRLQIFSLLAILAQLPEQVDALRKEQEQVFASHGPSLTPAALAAMPLLEACIKESTRLLSASRVVMRQATRPLQLCGVSVPAGAYMIISFDCLHAIEPTLWEGPSSMPSGSKIPVHMDWRHHLKEAYKPERWMGDASRRPKHMFTFGMGPHLCLGMNLVITEIKLLVALMLREGLTWQFADPDVLKKMSVFPSLKPAPGTDKVVLTQQYKPLRGSAAA